MLQSPCRALPGLVVCLLVACSPAPAGAPAADGAAADVPAADVAGAGAPDGASLVGEWSPEKDLCGDSRMTFTVDGRHEALMDDGGGWQVLASGTYQRDGRTLSIRFEGQEQQREIIAVDASTLVLRHDDEALAAVTGGYDVRLHRCPDRGPPPPA